MEPRNLEGRPPAARPSSSSVPLARATSAARSATAAVTPSPAAVAAAAAPVRGTAAIAPGAPYRDALLAEIKATKPTFYNLVVAQAFSIEADERGVTFRFQPNQKVPKQQCEENRALVQALIEKVTGLKRAVRIEYTDSGLAAPSPAAPIAAPSAAPVSGERKDAVMQNPTVQHLLEVFPVEKTTVQEE